MVVVVATDYIVFKSGVLITTLFVFFTTTMSVSFTLRETQARMLKFTGIFTIATPSVIEFQFCLFFSPDNILYMKSL